jgi:hypothetical protein
MLGSQSTRLRAALAAPTPAAARWRTATTTWLAGGDVYNFGAWNGALLSALTGAPAGCTKAVTVVDKQVADAEIRAAAGAAPEVAGDSYLHVGEMIGDLSLVYDWCFAGVTADQRARWIAYANQAVNNVWHPNTAMWGGKIIPWTGWGTNDPSNNYYYAFLRATMLLGLATSGENGRAAEWLTQFRAKLDGQLVPEFNRDLVGGGSREGTGYGVALRNLFELYALWEWSTGERIADKTPHTLATIGTVMQQITPGGRWKAPTGDQSRDSTAALFDYDRAELLELAALYPAAPESAWAVSLLGASSVPVMGSGFMYPYDFLFAPIAAVPNAAPLVRYSSGIGQIYARTSWAASATWLNLIAGPLTQSHAHEDQGSLMLYRGGPLATDAVIWSKGGVRQLPAPGRRGASYSLVGTTAAHSLVRIDVDGQPVPQRDSPAAGRLLALHVGPGYVFAAIDTTAAYAGAVQLVRRQVLWLQPDTVIVQDHVVTAPAAALTWQLVVPTAPVIAGPLATVTSAGHVLRVTRLAPDAGAWTMFRFDSHIDFTGGFRLDGVQPGGDRTFVTVLQVDSQAAVPAVTFADVGVSWGGITLGAGVDQL